MNRKVYIAVTAALASCYCGVVEKVITKQLKRMHTKCY